MTTVTRSELRLRKGQASPVSPNRAISRTELRDRIEAAALAAFRTRGFDQTSIDEIVVAADVAKGTFFNFFPAKQSVLAGFHATLDSQMAAQLHRLDPADPRASLARLFRALERILRAEGDLARVLFREITQDPSLGAADFESGTHDLEQYASFFEHSRAIGAIAPHVDPRAAAEVIQDLWSGSVQRWFRAAQRFSLSSTLNRKLEIVFAGLSGKANRGRHRAS